MPEMFHAACLSCTWVDQGGDGAEQAARAREHAVAAGGDPSEVARREVPVIPRLGGHDRPPRRRSF